MRLKDYLAQNIQGVPAEYLPSHAKLMDRVALVRLREEVKGLKREIGNLILRFYNVRAVYLVRGVEGVERRPRLELIAGEPIREVTHREYGCIFRLDIVRLMFCLGNSFERLRLAGLVSDGEIVVDMFAGIGQFTIPITVIANPEKVYAIEINPEAYAYLAENIRLNGVEDRAQPILGDCRRVAEEELRGIADRVIMGYFWGTIEALSPALGALKPEGGIIHFHDLARRGGEREFVENVLERARRMGYRVELLGWRRVKSYSRTRNHVVIDFFATRI
ncbi:MAG: class I SAM-dependent methyltransferase family protein [Aigarchaeota archaeon]|nr:class I SAM-dependent methyltransferase family protein [Candidatus Wolframiiraptor gerlachensis]